MDVLTDSYQRQHTYLRIALTERCNLRCRYCMPEAGIPLQARENILTLEEVLQTAKLFAGMGVTKIRLTGGEPLVRKGVPGLISSLKNIQGIKTVGLTTNGVLLHRYAGKLKDAGLDAVNISLDTLRPDRFETIARRPYFDDVLRGIEAAIRAGINIVKLNTVGIRGFNEDELCDFVAFANSTGINVRFIEYMPFQNNNWNISGFLGYREMIERISDFHALVPCTGSDATSVAKDFMVVGSDAKVSFITSMSEHFCNDCNRVRLTADGHVKACLFSAEEHSIREAIRAGADADVRSIIQNALMRKSYEHPPINELVQLDNRSMIRIGG